MEYKLVPVEPTREMVDAASGWPLTAFGLAEVYRAMLAAAPSPEWVPVSERLPKLEDADRDGYLWAYDGTEVHEINYTNVLIWSAWTHWMPKPRQTPPAPPTAAPESP